MNFELPLITPLSRKYYNYASVINGLKHHRAGDVRICLEYICDEIIYEFITDNDKLKWADYDLHKKLKASKHFLSKNIVDNLVKAKIVGNKGVHSGEEGCYNTKDIEDAMLSIKNFSLDVFLSYFKKNGFGNKMPSWIPTVFSILPPVYRVHILEDYLQHDKSSFVIDKLAKAYLKCGLEDKARSFLSECFDKKLINEEQYTIFDYDITLLKQSFHLLPIANNLDEAKENFNRLLPSIEEEKRDSFICLVSLILNGHRPS
ncbi:MAG: hypothetical protein FWH17_09620 [Oscillospiraceae bacterium]|nr:hypothetical protein [Oscillospiraceae bacterium]